MKQLLNILSRIRLRYRRSSLLLKCVVLAAIVLSTVTVITLSAARLEAEKREAQLRQEAAILEQENQELEDRISILGTVESVKQIANEILGLVDPDSVIFETE